MPKESSVEELLLAIVDSVMRENKFKDNNDLYKKIVASIWNREPLEVCVNDKKLQNIHVLALFANYKKGNTNLLDSLGGVQQTGSQKKECCHLECNR
jgi:hypothetical protein